jgi:cytochrome d ubiquinol oxidase subunit II
VIVTAASLIAVLNVRPGILDNFYTYPVGWLIPLVVAAALAAITYFNAKGKDRETFLASSVYLASMLGGAVFGLYPNVLPAIYPANSLTIYNARAGSYGLSVGIIWWSIGIIIALGYFTFLFRTFRGKIPVGSDVH